MALTIKKSYEENVQLAPFHFAKVGLEIASDKVLNSPAEVEEVSTKLGNMAKQLVRKELAQLKAQYDSAAQ